MPTALPEDMMEIMASLTSLMTEETELLRGREESPVMSELAAAKVRLSAQLEEMLARKNRLQPDWMQDLEEEAREGFRESVAALRAASDENMSILERQLELSTELLGAIANEARRAAGNRIYTYGAEGTMSNPHLPTPISFNTQY